MKTLKFFLIALMTICLFSCSSSSLKPTSAKINGTLGKYFEIVDRNYAIKDGKLAVEFKRIADGGPKDASWNSDPTFTVELLDADGNIVASEKSDVVLNSEELENVFSLAVNETTSITFNFENANGATQMRVTSKWDEDAENEDDTTESDDIASSSEDGNEKSGLQPSDIILPSQLKKFVEVINGAEGSLNITNGAGDIPHLEITFKLLKKTSSKAYENPYGQVFIYGIPQDESGRSISEILPSYGEWRPDDSDGSKFKEFLNGDVGETITLSFSGTSKKFDENCDNENGCKKVAKFKLAFNKDN